MIDLPAPPAFVAAIPSSSSMAFSAMQSSAPVAAQTTAPASQPMEPLEGRRMMAVHFAIDANADVHAISRYIYGVNQSINGALSGATATRAGGNRWTAYNWENNASNAGSDYQYQNDSFLSSSNAPGAAMKPTLDNAVAKNAAAIITVPMAGYVSADKNGGGDVRNSGANYLSTRFKVIQPRKGGAFTLTPDATDANVYADEMINWIKQTYPTSTTDPNKPVFFDLDNEPDLWSSTHAEVHPAKVTYAELIEKSIAYSAAIKDVMPNAKVFGPASYGWNGYTTLQDAPDRNNRDFLDTYLAQLKTASTNAGKRLVDVLDLHWYPEAQGGGVRITGTDTTAAVIAARLQAPRSLWDSTYTESSWITRDALREPINLLPRMKGKIAANNPGTDLAFTEYNYGGGQHISGGIAQADVLGIFGREGVFAANQWQLNTNETFVAGAFNMFRNYDGAGATFGDTSIRATTDDNASSSIYASKSSSNPNVLTLVAINKTANALSADVSLANLNIPANTVAKLFRLTSASASPQAAGTMNVGGTFTYSMPAYSVTTIQIPLPPVLPAPKVQASSFEFRTSPTTLNFVFDQDVSSSLSTASVSISRVGGGTVTPVSYTFDSTSNRATFALPTTLADGDYTATLVGVKNSQGTALASTPPVNFFQLAGDIDRDRVVGFSDLLILAQHYGTSGNTFDQGNLDGSTDGTVDFNDLLILAQNYGHNLGSAPLAVIASTTPAVSASKSRRG